MPKKAKKGGGKTEEEKLVYLQQRAEAEEELVQKKQELLGLFLKDKLQKEQRSSALNLRKLNDSWRSVLRQARSNELHRDVSVLGQTCERQLDGLDAVIKRLEQDLQEAQRHWAQVNRVHLQNLERLWAQHDQWRRTQQQRWERGLQQLQSRVQSERKQMVARCEELRAHLDEAALSVEQQDQDAKSEAQRLYEDSITEFQNSPAATRFNLLNVDREELTALTNIKEKQQKISTLRSISMEQNVVLRKACAEDRVDIEKVYDDKMESLAQITSYIEASKEKQDQLEQEVTDAGKKLDVQTVELRVQRRRAQAAARTRMMDLTVNSSGANRKLQEVVKKGERVLRVAGRCNELETEQEVTFTASSSARQEPEQRPEFPELLMGRANAALLRREVLKKQRADLGRENQQLKLLLRRHLDAMTRTSAVNGPNALLAVYQAPTAARAEPSRRLVVIEAAHAVKHTL